MFQIDPSRTELAEEFKARPYGIHSPDLQAVLNLMRGLPIEGKHVLIMNKPHEQWTLAQLEGDPLKPRMLSNHVFASLEEAEWYVFKVRWEMLTGQKLEID